MSVARLRRLLGGEKSRAGHWPFALLVLIIAVVGVSTTTSTFLSPANLENLPSQIAPLLIASLGQMLVVLTGGFDLSIGSVVSLTTTVVVLDVPLWAMAGLLICVAVVVGGINGVGIAYFNVHPLIMTLATMSIIQGAALLIQPVPGGTVPPVILSMVRGTLWGIPPSLIWIAVATLAAAWILYRTRYGLHVFAIGGSWANAHLNGVSVRLKVVFAYILCSAFAVTAGVFLSARIASGDASVGATLGLDSVTAVALGGTSLAGGIGSVVGTVVGAILVGILSNSMNLLNVSAYLQAVVKGLLLLVVISVQRRKQIGM